MSIEYIAIIVAVVLMGLGLISLISFGIRNLTYGKHNYVSIIMGALPVLLLFAFKAMGMEWSDAGVWAAVVAFGLAILALLLSSLRGLIGL